VLFEDLGVFGDEVLAAEGADGHGLCSLDGRAVLVHLDAGAGGVGLLVLARDAVFLGDRHVGRECVFWFVVAVFGVGCVLVVVVNCPRKLQVESWGRSRRPRRIRP
jgi:hypothetical protein